MKAAPLLVSWHNDNTPIYSAHFEPHGKGRLATAGGDNNVRVRRPLRLAGRSDADNPSSGRSTPMAMSARSATWPPSRSTPKL
jgi:hypothetical protein